LLIRHCLNSQIYPLKAITDPRFWSLVLQFAAKHKIHPFIQERPLKEVNQAVIDMDKGNARYRYVLVNEKHAAEEKA
jgi:alcohol dehydrogenase (NADP+)